MTTMRCAAVLLLLSTSALVAQDTANTVERGTKVVPGRPARVFVMAGFDKECRGLKPVVITIDRAPEKGSVSFQENQQTTIQHSVSGRCIGARIVGTGIYYTARAGATGTDTFAVTARLGGDTASRTFTVGIAED